MKGLYTLTIAFCPASQLARSLMEYRKNRTIIPEKHIVVLGHYPINKKKNDRDIKMIVESYGEAELWDPGENLGSAQSQNWALSQLPDCDYWINWDPDSNCRIVGWDSCMKYVLDQNPHIVLVSCWAPMIARVVTARKQEIKYTQAGKTAHGYLSYGTSENSQLPFNLSMFRQSFVQEMGGLRQGGEHWGELEGIFHYEAKTREKTCVYLMEYMEDETGKFMQDRQFLEYKNKHLRTTMSEQFMGSYAEYLATQNYLDTFIPDETIFE